MSILPVLGHKPITSYFSRTSSLKRKRKDKAGPLTEGISKRPKQTTSYSFPSSSTLVNIVSTKANIGDGLKWANGSSYSSRDKADFPCTPPGNRPWKQILDGTLPTPPLTCMAPHRPRKAPEKEPSLSPQMSVSPRCQVDVSENTSLPTPPSPKIKLSDSTSFQPSGPSASLLPELTIPSSQSQDSHPSMEMEILTSFSRFSGNLSLLRPTEDENLIIESSQSQLLLVASPNTRRLDLEPTLPDFNVVIPSSQSQEEELIIPTEKDIETGARGSLLIGTARRGFGIPQRILPEKQFSVPIQVSILDNIFLDEQADTPPAENNPDSVNPATFAASDAEDEHEGFRNSFYKRSLEPTSRSAARASDSQSSLGTGSYSSLPPEVWEFRKMFENGDENYPADFPESLRS